ncbi:MAG: amino acid--tRNA ligase-related protein [Candidatus Dojkabacteria bacterium]|nr:amino acid--tRNA ligase-related protein [Candidatus Dojkabacteria bacterium]
MMAQFLYNDTKIKFFEKWQRKSVRELFKENLDTNLEDIISLDGVKILAEKLNVKILDNDDWHTIFDIIFSEFIETKFPEDIPIFVYDYPKIMCPLTKPSETDPLVSQKVELYIARKEIANGYTELLDADLQKENFDREQKARAELGRPEIKYDNDLIDALSLGIPKVAGIGMGLDRLAMILANAKSISDINFFPASEWN